MKLNKEQNHKVEEKIKQFEENTGCELVVAIAEESDPYPAAPLRFGFLAMITLSLIATYYFEFHIDTYLVFAQLILMIILAQLGRIPYFKKLMLLESEVQREVGEKSIELFYQLCSTKTEHKVSTLLYISLLEKQIRLLVDKDLNEKIDQKKLDNVVHNLSNELKNKKFGDGVIHAIDTIEQMVLEAFGEKLNQVAPNEIKNKVFWL